VTVKCDPDNSPDEMLDKAARIMRAHGGFIRRDDLPPEGPPPPTMDNLSL